MKDLQSSKKVAGKLKALENFAILQTFISRETIRTSHAKVMPSRHAKLKERVRVEKCKHSREEFHEFFRLQSQEVLCLQLQSLEVGAGR